MLGDVVTGGGDAFLDWIAEEVTALVRKHVPALKSPPALAGYSLGGLFVLGAMLRQTHSFGGYAAISPALWADAWKTSRSVAKFQPSAPVRLHLSVGELEVDDGSVGIVTRMRESVCDLAAEIKNTEKLDHECHIELSAAHYSTVPSALIHAARYLFPTVSNE